ncbi:MAG: fructokinase [Paracoccaceae bacterium]
MVTHAAEAFGPFGPFGHVAVPGRKVAVVDTVGACGSFMAALIAGLAARGSKDRAALAGLDAKAVGDLLAGAARAAAITCGRAGADLPRLANFKG